MNKIIDYEHERDFIPHSAFRTPRFSKGCLLPSKPRPHASTNNALSVARAAAWRQLIAPSAGRAAAAETDTEDATRRDRAQANRLVHGVLRNLRLIDAWLNRPRLFDPARTPMPLVWVLRLAVYEKIFQANVPDYAIGEQTVELARKAGGAPAGRFANAIMRRLLPTLPASYEAMKADPFWAELPPATRWSVPPEIVQALAAGYGFDLEPLLQAMTEREGPVWLRVNTLKTTPEKLMAELAAAGVETAPYPSAPPEALLWSGSSALPWSADPWRRGELTVQDAGAMLAARLLAPEPGQAVADCCAAPGGKTGHLWELMRGRGRLVALEVSPERRRELCQAMTRLYGERHAIEIPDDNRLQAQSFDRVLVDAPCQALGLIKRHPEIRWDGRLRQQAAMCATQAQVLESAARLVRPGGRLLWVTCSPTAAENEALVRPWLAAHPEWRALDPRPALPPQWADWTHWSDAPGALRTRPDRLDCDAFAMILLERASA